MVAQELVKRMKCLGLAGAFFVSSLLSFGSPKGVADTLIVHNLADHSLSFLALPSGKEVARLGVKPHVYDLHVTADGRDLIASSYSFPAVSPASLQDVMQQVFDVSSAALKGEIGSPEPLSPNVRKIRRSFPLGDEVMPHPPSKLAGQFIAVGRSFYLAEMMINRVPLGLTAFSQKGVEGYIYYSNTRRITVLDMARNAPLRRFELRSEPQTLDLSPDERVLWVASNTQPIIELYDVQSGGFRRSIALQSVATRLLSSPDKRWIVAAHYGAGSLTIIDRASQQVTTTVTLDVREGALSKPAQLLFDRAGTRLFISLPLEGRVALLDALNWSLQSVFDAGLGAHGLALSPIDVSQ